MKFEKEVKGKWFYFIEEKPELGGVCLRLPTSAECDDIRRLSKMKADVDYHKGQRYETERFDEKRQTKLSLRKFIVDWKEVELDGQPMECTDENKEKMVKVQDFQLFVGECIEKMTEGNKTIEAARVKNLETSPDGDSE